MRVVRFLSGGWAGVVCAVALGLGGSACSAELGSGASGEDGTTAKEFDRITFGLEDYLFFQTPLTWAVAASTCKDVLFSQQKYRLAAANDADEEAFLQGEELAHGGGGWWVAITDQVKEGQFTDGLNGPPAYYTNWHQGEPNNQGNEDCTIDNSFPDGTWNDYPCNQKAKFVCEGPSVIGTVITSLTPYSAVSTNSALNVSATTRIEFFMWAGQPVTVGTCGTDGATSDGDTFLRLFNPQGQEVANNDDACGGRGSNVSYVATTSGTFFVRAGCYADDACSGNVVVALPPLQQ